MSRSNQSTIHVALVGMTGVGKSTLVNVLQGKEVAAVNNNVRPCTTKVMQYDVMEGATRYRIWDTRGLNEGLENAAIATRTLRFFRIIPDADRELKEFLRSKEQKVDLVLLCMDARKIKVEAHWKMYDKIYADMGEKKLTVAVVVTQLGEGDLKRAEWKKTCEVTARNVVKKFPTANLIEGVPKFEDLRDPSVTACKRRILSLISNSRKGGC